MDFPECDSILNAPAVVALTNRGLSPVFQILIFDEATSSLDSATAEHFAATINQLRGKVTMLFITHALPKGLQVDEVVRIGGGTLAPVPMSQDKDGV